MQCTTQQAHGMLVVVQGRYLQILRVTTTQQLVEVRLTPTLRPHTTLLPVISRCTPTPQVTQTLEQGIRLFIPTPLVQAIPLMAFRLCGITPLAVQTQRLVEKLWYQTQRGNTMRLLDRPRFTTPPPPLATLLWVIKLAMLLPLAMPTRVLGIKRA